MEQEFFTFIVLHYNCFEATKECVESILGQQDRECIKILVIDNASTNDSLQLLQEKYGDNPQVYLLHNKENLGFSRGNNRAYQFARQHWQSEFVVFANNDIVFEQRDFVSRVRQEYARSGFGVLGPDVYHAKAGIHQSPISDQTVLPISSVRKTILLNTVALAVFPLFYFFFHNRMQETEYESRDLSYRKDVVLMGACLIFSKAFMDKREKIFSPETFFYYEEYILSLWCKRNQVTSVFQPDIQVIHNHGVSTGSIGDMRQVMKFKMKNILEAAKIYYKMLVSGRGGAQ